MAAATRAKAARVATRGLSRRWGSEMATPRTGVRLRFVLVPSTEGGAGETTPFGGAGAAAPTGACPAAAAPAWAAEAGRAGVGEWLGAGAGRAGAGLDADGLGGGAFWGRATAGAPLFERL